MCALVQTAFLSTSLASNIGSGASIALPLASYTQIDSLMANGDTIELVINRNAGGGETKEVILATKNSNGNYTITTRGLYQTSAATHSSGTTAGEVTNDDTPGYFNGLREGSAVNLGSSSWSPNLGYAQVTANQGSITTQTDLTSLAVTVTVPSGGRSVRITGYGNFESTVATDRAILFIMEGATQLNFGACYVGSANLGMTINTEIILTPTAGSHTYKLQAARGGTGTLQLDAASTNPAFIKVELI